MIICRQSRLTRNWQKQQQQQLSSGWKLAFYVVGGTARYLLNLEISSFSLLLISFANTALSATEAAALRPAGTSAAAAVKYTFFPMKKIHVIES